MQIIINNTPVNVLDNETILETARRAGYVIPSLCYANGAQHKSSCMVCVVKNCSNGQIIPSCTTYPIDGMQIETESDEVKTIRSLSLELLLSDHRADCEAPCSLVCPENLDIERMLKFYDLGQYAKAYSVIAAAFALPKIGCDGCKAPCEKACRRASVDKTVSIREIIKEIIEVGDSNPSIIAGSEQKYKTDKKSFRSLIGRFSEREKSWLIKNVTTSSRCLHCACDGSNNCKLRLYATAEGIKRSRYAASTALPIMSKQHIHGNLWFEQSKCIRCGLCVYNSENGFTFKDRGFGMQVFLSEENKINVSKELADLCPTGAIYNLEL